MLEILIDEYRSHRWARFAVRLATLGVIFRVVQFAVGLYVHTLVFSEFTGAFWLLFKLAAAVIIVYYLVRLAGFLRRHLLWRLTRRLIVTYLFIAVVPIILIFLWVSLGAIIVNGQFAAFLVNARLRNHFDEIKQLNRVVAHEAVHIQTQDPNQLLDALEKFYLTDLREYASSYPGLEITLRAGGQARAFRLTGGTLKRPIFEPAWLSKEEWAGFVMSRGEISLRAADKEETRAGRLTLILSMPITPELLNIVGHGIGPVAVIPLVRTRPGTGPAPARKARSPFSNKGGNLTLIRYRVASNSVPLPKPRIWFDYQVHGASALNPVLWRAPTFRQRSNPILVVASSRIFELNAQLLNVLGKFASAPVEFFKVVGIVFLVIEIAALVIGVTLTRSITTTVNRLQDATEKVKSGDLSHRIGISPHDQVSSLGAAFDTMTASVERLMIESREKVRMENELKIAHEVQQQLFPQGAPAVPGATMFGECRPARGVSGDFYDFLKLDKQHVGLVLGDVSGKGIYAALLMAGIQSAVRAQFYNGQSSLNSPLISTATVLDRLNRQVYDNTPDAKYATLFYAVYDAGTRNLAYTNAGHHAPFLFRRDKIMRLEAGGTVIGLFPAAQYKQEQIQLETGDVLLAFTDGLVEPENSYGEEFGVARLAAAVREALHAPPQILAREVYRTVIEWSGSTELEDDMTMLYLKATE